MNHLLDSDWYHLNVDWIENLDWTLIEKTVLGGKCPTIDCVQSFNRCTIDENQGCLKFSVETRLSRLYPIVPDCDSILDLQSMYNRRQSMTIHYNPDSILDCTCSHRLSLDWMSFTIRLQSIQSSNNKMTIKNENNNNKKKNCLQDLQSFNPASILLQSWLIHGQSSFNPLSIKDQQSYTNPYNQETILQKWGGQNKKISCFGHVRLYTIGHTIEWQSCTNLVEVRSAQGSVHFQSCSNRCRLWIISTIFSAKLQS